MKPFKRFFRSYPLVTPKAFFKDLKKFQSWDWYSKAWAVLVFAFVVGATAFHSTANFIPGFFGFVTALYFSRWAVLRVKKRNLRYEVGFMALVAGFCLGYGAIFGTVHVAQKHAMKNIRQAIKQARSMERHNSERHPASARRRGYSY